MDVNSRQHGVRAAQPLPSLCEKYQLTVANGNVQMKRDKPFRILVANLGDTLQSLVKNGVIGSVTPHPLAMMPSTMTAVEILGTVTDDSTPKGE